MAVPALPLNGSSFAVARAKTWIAPCYALGLTSLILAPLMAPGYLLLRDAVSTPRSYLTATALGLGETSPRAVPQDFAMALASRVIDGGIVVKLLLFAGLWLAGYGAARLVALALPEAGLPGQLVGTTVALWNPYVAERLLQGHWSLLVGYGALPWLAMAMLRLRAGETGLLRLVFFLALAGLTPTGLLLGLTVALVCVAVPGDGPPRWWSATSAVAIAATAALPWLMALVLSTGTARGEAAGVAAFAARAEPGLGTLGSLTGLGGIWNVEAVPSSRHTIFALVATLVFVAVLALGWPEVRERTAVRPLLILAVSTVLAVTALASKPGQATLRWAMEIAPGLGILRDGQKWLALAMPGYVLAGAGAVIVLGRRMPPARAAAACCAALIVALPDLSWGVAGRIHPVHYPPGWQAVAAIINADPRPVAVLPAGSMRQFPWTKTAPVLDPLPRWLRAEVLTTGDLRVGDQTVPGEGAHARDVQQTLLTGADPTALGIEGVGWVVRETSRSGDMGAADKTLHRLPIAYQDSDITLYRVGGRSQPVSAGSRRAAIAAHLAWLGLLVVGAAVPVASRLRRLQVSRRHGGSARAPGRRSRR